MSDEFEATINEAKRLETKVLEYMPYKGEVKLDKTLDLEPKEYLDYTYPDLVNLYERNQKILSTVAMGLLSMESESSVQAPRVISKPAAEVEIKLREMTTQTLQTAEEVAKEPSVLEKETIELEKFHVEPPKHERIEFEVQHVSDVRPEEPKPDQKVIVANVPAALKDQPAGFAVEKYEKTEEQIRAAVGEKPDEMALKKKMFELTKELFKERTTSRREELKLQILVLKNMLRGTEVKVAKAKKKEELEVHTKVLDALITAHVAEIAQTKDNMIVSYKKQIHEIQEKFYHDLTGVDDAGRKKEILEAFVFSITSLAEQLPSVIEKYRNITVAKHITELEKVKAMLGPEEKDTLLRIESEMEKTEDYGQDFASVKGIIGKEIENLVDVAGAQVFRKPDEKPRESEEKVQEIIEEISSIDEGTLLYYLHGVDHEYYKRYEHKQISKSEAIFKAKELMALEKGLSAGTVKKYFSQKED